MTLDTLGSRKFVRLRGVEEAPLSGELMLFEPETGRFFVLNRTMASVWRCCDGTHSVEQMIEGLKSDFEGVDVEAARVDVGRALEQLVSFGLVTESQGVLA